MLFRPNLARAIGGASLLALVSALLLLSAPNASSQTSSFGTISGTVTNAGGDPLAGICVDAWGGGVWPTKTDAHGKYTAMVSPGTYKVEFSVCESGNYVDEWFEDQPDRNAATPISISAGQTFTADASLATAGRITGTVTDAGHQPLAGVCVAARRQQDAFSHHGITDQAGNYVIEGLASGAYQVAFLHCDAGSYINEYYDNHLDEASADPVSVSVGTTTANINAELALGAAISGRVVGPAGQPVEHVCVHAQTSEVDRLAPSAETDANGEYELGGLQPATYRVLFVSCGPGPYGREWFDNKSDWQSAVPVVATIGTITTGINADFSTPPDPPSPTPPAADVVAPAVTIASGPSGKTTQRRPRFTFTSDDPTAAFECAVDAADPRSCASPATLKKLKYGKHTVSVTAIDPAGNRGPAAKRQFKVSKKPRKDH